MSKLRLRQQKLLISGAIGAVAMLVICMIVGIIYTNSLKNKFTTEKVSIEQQLATTQQKLEEDTVAVPVTTKLYKAGQKVMIDTLKTVQMPKSAVPQGAVLQLDKLDGKLAKIDLPVGSPVTSEVVYEKEVTTKDERNQEFNLIKLPLKLQKEEYVDVRVKFPSGQDYIVLSKKRVEDLSAGTVWYHMNEKEILSMSGAIVDAYLNDATIYALSYVEPGLQDAAIETYPANKNVLDLIESDPNIVEKATTELERRNRVSLEAALKALSPTDVQNYKAAIAENQAKQDAVAEAEANSESNDMADNAILGGTEVTPEDSNVIFNDKNDSVPVK